VWLAPGDRVLKVVDTGAEALAEAAVLQRARGEHVVDLLDLAIDDLEAVLVLPRLPRGSLAQLLERRAGLDAGEAVTVLAPIATCLARLHAAGVAHGAVSADHVLFREDGAPVLIGFGSARLFEPGLPAIAREQIEGVGEDRRALCALADLVLRRVTGRRAPAATELAERLLRSGGDEAETVLSSELFELAAARPIRFDTDADIEHASGPPRVIGVASAPALDGGAPGLLTRMLESGPAHIARQAVQTRWHAWNAGRRRLALALASAAIALVIAVLAIPSPSAAPAADGPKSPPPAAPLEPTVDDQVSGDDPLEALAALLGRRSDCFRDLSELCLADVDEQGSSALAEDSAALDALVDQAVQPVLLDATDATLVQRLGDSALISLSPGTEPASLLLLKGEAGWRIRDYIADPDD
jgi:hypothetical protein